MQIGPTLIVDAHAEAFAARYTRLIITAADESWLRAATDTLCGYGTSVIGCDVEIAIERPLAQSVTPDRRPGAALLAFAFNKTKLGKAIANRVGQGLLTCPTAALFDGLPESEDRLPLGNYLRYFGDRHEEQETNAWRIPVMEGEVLLPATLGSDQGIAGGNLILQGADPTATLAAARRAVEAVASLPEVITPFPGGVCRSGSKVGSHYKNLIASTNEVYCPSLKQSVTTKLQPGVTCVYEIVFNGTTQRAVRSAMRQAMRACAGEGLLAITAGDYGGKLGKTKIRLHELI